MAQFFDFRFERLNFDESGWRVRFEAHCCCFWLFADGVVLNGGDTLSSAASNGLRHAVVVGVVGAVGGFPLQSAVTVAAAASVSMLCWSSTTVSPPMVSAAMVVLELVTTTMGDEQVNFAWMAVAPCFGSNASLSLPSESASKPVGWMSFRPL